jgi:hypothetical protein
MMHQPAGTGEVAAGLNIDSWRMSAATTRIDFCSAVSASSASRCQRVEQAVGACVAGAPVGQCPPASWMPGTRVLRAQRWRWRGAPASRWSSPAPRPPRRFVGGARAGPGALPSHRGLGPAPARRSGRGGGRPAGPAAAPGGDSGVVGARIAGGGTLPPGSSGGGVPGGGPGAAGPIHRGGRLVAPGIAPGELVELAGAHAGIAGQQLDHGRSESGGGREATRRHRVARR